MACVWAGLCAYVWAYYCQCGSGFLWGVFMGVWICVYGCLGEGVGLYVHAMFFLCTVDVGEGVCYCV